MVVSIVYVTGCTVKAINVEQWSWFGYQMIQSNEFKVLLILKLFMLFKSSIKLDFLFISLVKLILVCITINYQQHPLYCYTNPVCFKSFKSSRLYEPVSSRLVNRGYMVKPSCFENVLTRSAHLVSHLYSDKHHYW